MTIELRGEISEEITDLVVFEKLYLIRDGEEVLIAEHTDPMDEDQTVTREPEEPEEPEKPEEPETPEKPQEPEESQKIEEPKEKEESVPDEPEKTQTPEKPDTGDHMLAGLYIAVFAVAVLGMVLYVLRRKLK